MYESAEGVIVRMQHMRVPKARLYATRPSLYDRAGTLASGIYSSFRLLKLKIKSE